MSKLGQIFLYAAFLVSVIQGSFLLYGAIRNDYSFIKLAKPVAIIHWFFVVTTFACLAYLFLFNDFSIRYVADISSSSLPVFFRIPAIWGGHEGSLLLMSLVLSTMSLLVAMFSRGVPVETQARVLGVLGLIATVFLFLVFTSNPFESVPPQADGRGLRPVLQETAMILHPLFTVFGVIGFGVVFAYSVVEVFESKKDVVWARWVKPWISMSWVFLTVGVALGSWWSYREAWWGGLWVWDPVQNLSLVIWLVATALVLSVVATENNSIKKIWTLSLGMFTFCLSILMIYLVHSEKLLTTHDFTKGYEQSSTMLYFVYILVGVTLVVWLYGFMKNKFSSTVNFPMISKETMLIVNISLLIFMACIILLATTHPFITDFLNIPPIKMRIGSGFYNLIITPIGALLVFTLGLGLVLRWNNESLQKSILKIFLPMFLAIVSAVLLPLIFALDFNWVTFIGLSVSSWIVFTVTIWFYNNKRRSLKVSKTSLAVLLGAIGLAFTTIGITFVSVYEEVKDIKMVPGENKALFGYSFEFFDIKKVQGPNYISDFSTIRVMRGDKELAVLNPEKRNYSDAHLPTTETDTDTGIFHHIYASLGVSLGNQGAWSFRLQYQPFHAWIWLGVTLMSIAGLLVAFDPVRNKT